MRDKCVLRTIKNDMGYIHLESETRTPWVLLRTIENNAAHQCASEVGDAAIVLSDNDSLKLALYLLAAVIERTCGEDVVPDTDEP
ncbi:MAG: hypothetical protein ACWGQW_11950 [bacterium]